MPTLQEIMAAKKAAAASANSAALATNDEPKVEIDIGEIKTAPAIINTEVAVGTNPKALTFAEKMALKKQTGDTLSVAVPVSSAGKVLDVVNTGETDSSFGDNVSAERPKVKASTIPVPVVDATTVSTPAKVDTTTAEVAAMSLGISSVVSSNAEQAYADIERRIENLVNLSDTPLENAMHDLKVALLANPNAVALMQDSDFGKMVIALRKVVGEAATEATKEGSTKKTRTKKVNFQNPDEVAAAFEEI